MVWKNILKGKYVSESYQKGIKEANEDTRKQKKKISNKKFALENQNLLW